MVGESPSQAAPETKQPATSGGKAASRRRALLFAPPPAQSSAYLSLLDEAEFDAFKSWLGHHRDRMVANPAMHAVVRESWQETMREHHAKGMGGEPMMERPENGMSSMDVTKRDDFLASYWTLFDRDESESVSRDEWAQAFDVLYPDVHPEARAEGGVNRQTEW